MATKRRLKYACEFCGKRFATLPALWGHSPHHRKHNLSLEPATQLGAEPRPSVLADRESRRPGPDAQEMKFILINTNEGLTQLHSDAGHHAFWADFLARTASAHVEGHAPPEGWFKIYEDLGDVTREFDLMVGPLRLDRRLLFTVYHRMRAIQDAWLEYQRRDFSRNGELTTEGEEVLRGERALFADLMLNIKRMVVAAR